MLKIIVLGGTGDMGSHTVRELAREPGVTTLTIAGRNLEAAQRLAARIGPPARPLAVDVSDRDALVAALRQHDVVASALGPFYRYEVPVAQAAIEAGVHYVSICDDYDAVEAVLQLDQQARERGVTVLTGAGWTPGLTNLMALKGAALLDEAREVHMSWAAAFAGVEGFASIPHVIHAFTGQVPTYMDGRPALVRAGTGGERVKFPDPLGAVWVSHCGHPEPVTMPRFIEGLTDVTLRGGVVEGLLNSFVIALGRIRLMADPGRRERLVRLLRPVAGLLSGLLWRNVPPLAGTHVVVKGIKGGRPAQVTLAAVDTMGRLTGIPHAVMTLMVGRGQITRRGVFAPEADGGPGMDEFFEEIAARGLKVEVGSPTGSHH